MWIRRVLQIAAALASAFVLTSAVMFWLPFLETSTGYWIPISATPVYDIIDTAYPSTAALNKLSPSEERLLLETISDELKRKQNAELYQIKAHEDFCTNDLVDCQGLASSKIKPFIDAILSDRQAAEAAFYYRTANVISGGSPFISFIALIFAGLTYSRKAFT